MQVEDTEKDTKLNIMNFDGKKPQVDADKVSLVILTSGQVIPCIKGSFHFFVTKAERAMPFVQFDTNAIGNPNTDQVTRVEIFPTNMAGVGYYVEA